jgi:hypothetical protein
MQPSMPLDRVDIELGGPGIRIFGAPLSKSGRLFVTATTKLDKYLNSPIIGKRRFR